MPELASGGAAAAPEALRDALAKPLGGFDLSRDEAIALLETPALTDQLLATASALRDRAWGRTLTYSPKVFLPVTNLCRDRCTYCTFRKDPDDPDAWTMSPDEIAAWSARGRALGCKEALMCLGDKPEVAFPAYRATLAGLGHRSTAEYVERGPSHARRDGAREGGQRQPGAHARERLAAAPREGAGASVGAGQGARAPPPHAARGGRAPDPLHHRVAARHRRDARRARRYAP